MYPELSELSSFAARLQAQIRQQPSPLKGREWHFFNALAVELFSLQFKYNPVYRKICEARGMTSGQINHWSEAPAVPTALFKELEMTSLLADERTAVFHSSGTTEQRPSRHFHNAKSLALYESSLWSGFGSHFGEVGELIILTPNAKAAPNSSLIHMFECVRQKYGQPASSFTGSISSDGAWGINYPAALLALKQACDSRRPVTLLGTAFSFVHLLDRLTENQMRFQLPHGSRVMETGGYKNRSRFLPKPELHALITDRLGVSPENIICEYGMSELSSQAYDEGGIGRIFHFPAWAQVQIISPETGREVADGETGIIRIFDLANVFSVAAIQTEDLGIRRGDGFELVGRTQLAEPRGCSLMTA